MAIRLDPEGTEKNLLFEMAEGFGGKRVLEVGCGAGRLTWRYAEQAAAVVGIDLDSESIAEAKATTPPNLKDKVEFWTQGILDYTPGMPFDVVILSWSLC